MSKRLFPARHPSILRQVAQVLGALVVLTIFAAIAPSKAKAATIAGAYDSVVILRSADNKNRFLGSGFVWGDGALVVTNDHVAGMAESIRIVDAKGMEHQGEVIGRDPVRDVAVISVPGLKAAPIPLGPLPAPGDEVWAIGAPLELGMTLTRGVISAHARQVEAAVPIRFLQHDAAVNPGSSGGPLLDSAGRLVGMNSRIADGSRYYVGISYAISADDLARIVGGLVDETLLPFPKLGLQLRPVTREIAAALGMEPKGVLIDRVYPGALAESAGLHAGDILVGAAGRDLETAGDLAFAIDAALGAGQMALRVIRGGQEIAVTLGFAPATSSVLALRGMEGAVLNRVSSYRFESLGLVLDDDARVTTVSENSPALFAGIIRSDIILAVNGKRLSAGDLRKLEITAPTLILLQRGGGATLHVMLDPWDTGEGIRAIGGANVLDPAIVVF
ncbi:S1C family serine protease [Pseudorhodobacter sp.]|uniref:S1C family serine protease n=1 Tax=Pseudorhodobacter sp. TaxID=1934400 RepID=UPI002AFF0470|nr:trypsin-like peptidase domain-containing protein [Pseudorhodobacter sp.]